MQIVLQQLNSDLREDKRRRAPTTDYRQARIHRPSDIEVELMMFRELTLAAAIVVGSVTVFAPVFAAEGSGEVGDGFNRTEREPSGFGEAYDGQYQHLARHRDGFDGDRYWSDGECFPTAPGGCD